MTKKTRLVVYDFSNNNIKPTKEIIISLNDLKSFTSTLITEIDNYLDHDSLQKIVAISITMPGFINTELGINSSFPMEDERYQIRNIIERKYHKQTFIENDSTAIAIAEHRFGLAKDIDAANKGDQLAIETIDTIAYALGKGIVTLIHIINPEKIIISGFGAKLTDFLMPQIQNTLLAYSIQRLSTNNKIEISTLNNPQLSKTWIRKIY